VMLGPIFRAYFKESLQLHRKKNIYGHLRRPRGELGERSSQILRWGMAHAFVPPIFREVVLSDARESTNRVKKDVIKELFCEIGSFLVSR